MPPRVHTFKIGPRMWVIAVPFRALNGVASARIDGKDVTHIASWGSSCELLFAWASVTQPVVTVEVTPSTSWEQDEFEGGD